MLPDSKEFQEGLKRLQEKFKLGYPGRVRTIRAAWAGLEAAPEDPKAFAEFHRLVHNLSGSGGLYGLPFITEVGRSIEAILNSAAGHGRRLTEAQWAEVEQKLTRLDDALPEIAASAAPASPEPSAEKPVFTEERLIYLVDDDPDGSRNLATQLGHFGFRVRILEGVKEVFAAVVQQRPAAILMDMVFPEGPLAGGETVFRMRTALGEGVPVIFVSARDDLASRLTAVRAGGAGYATKPVDIDELAERLDDLTAGRAADPFRVLIIDDDADLAAGHARILDHAGMQTAVVTRPMEVVEPLMEFHPDLILMDLYMPACGGEELAAVIRQQKAFLGVPIVYLSSEGARDRQLAALGQGGDDFITKPVDPANLISTVRIRARQARDIRSMMTRDGLTGLLSHSPFKDRLESELSQARRRKGPLAFAMIDLDFFKQVNDAHGHSAGSRVLKSLSAMLRQRLRRSDVIGRYGGEEFGVILPDVDPAEGFKVIDQMRASWGQVRHHHDGKDFVVTLSAGVSGFPACGTGTQLIDAADAALYEAKRQGRNRVIAAS